MLIPGHPDRAGMPQVMHRPVGAQLLVRPPEHRPQRVIVQLDTVTAGSVGAVAPQRPPQRIAWLKVPNSGKVETQPHERFLACREPLRGTCAFTPNADQLIAPV